MKTKADHRNKIRKIKKKTSISTDHLDYSRNARRRSVSREFSLGTLHGRLGYLNR